MKKIFAIAITISMFSCNTNENRSAEKKILETSSNLELAKSTFDEILNNADYYENNESAITAPLGSKESLKLDSIKAILNKEDLERFNDYANNKFDGKYNTGELSNLELAKSVFDKMLENADYYENNVSTIMAPYGSKLSFQLQSIKAKLTKKEMENFHEYSIRKYNEKYPNS